MEHSGYSKGSGHQNYGGEEIFSGPAFTSGGAMHTHVHDKWGQSALAVTILASQCERQNRLSGGATGHNRIFFTGTAGHSSASVFLLQVAAK